MDDSDDSTDSRDNDNSPCDFMSTEYACRNHKIRENDRPGLCFG